MPACYGQITVCYMWESNQNTELWLLQNIGIYRFLHPKSNAENIVNIFKMPLLMLVKHVMSKKYPSCIPLFWLIIILTELNLFVVVVFGANICSSNKMICICKGPKQLIYGGGTEDKYRWNTVRTIMCYMYPTTTTKHMLRKTMGHVRNKHFHITGIHKPWSHLHDFYYNIQPYTYLLMRRIHKQCLDSTALLNVHSCAYYKMWSWFHMKDIHYVSL